MFIFKRNFSYIIIAMSLAITMAIFFCGLGIVDDLHQLRKSEVSLFKQSHEVDQNFREFQRALGFGGFVHNVKEYLVNRKPEQLFILMEDIKKVENAYGLLRIQFESYKSAYALETLDEFIASLRNAFQFLNAPENQQLDAIELNNRLDLENPRFLSAIVTIENLKDNYNKESINRIQSSIAALVSNLILASVLLPITLAIGCFLVWLLNHTVTANQKLEEANQKLKEAEDSYSTLFNSTRDGCVINKGSGELIRSNPAFAKMLGYDIEEINTISWKNITPKKWLEWELKTHGTMLLERGFTNLYEKEYYRKDGSVFPVEVQAYLLNKADTLENAVIAAFIRDITVRKKAEEALRESEARLKKMIEKSPLPMVITNQKQDITFFNDKFIQLFGYTLEDVSTAEEWWNAAYPNEDYRQRVQNSWQIAIDKASVTGSDIEMQEWDLTIKDGSTRRCEFYMVPLEEVSLIIMNDISKRIADEEDRKKLEYRLLQAEKMESIGTLAGGIAHDFNNILSAILGYAEMIQDDCPVGSQISSDIDQILKAGNRAKELVKQILFFSRQGETNPIPLQPAVIIKESLKMLRASLPTTISIEQDIAPDVGSILANPTQIHQIITNLCTNAFHAMEIQGGTLTVSLHKKSIPGEDSRNLSHMQSKDFVKLSIKDTGVGIAPEIREKIFEPYFTTKEVDKGTGMGLAMVHGIVQSYGGSIVCNSRPGEGTVFHITLPIVKEDGLPKTVALEIIPGGNEHILLIDDEVAVVSMTKTLLERLGYQVTTSTNSIEALDTFLNKPETFDLIITDQTMPKMAGADLSREILQIRPDIPIILCTGYSSIISEDKAMAIGIKAMAMKPLAKKEIASLIRMVLDAKK